MTQYAGWSLDDPSALATALAMNHVHRVHAAVDGVTNDHITYAYPADEAAPALDMLVIVGEAHDDRCQALIVSGACRPDHKWLHVTYSLADGVRPEDSNRLLASLADVPHTWFRRQIWVPVTPFLRNV